MNHTERLAFTEGIFEQCLDIMRTKGLSYASEGDASENFKRTAELNGQTKYEVWSTFFLKHVLSLCNAVKRNPDLPAVADGEPIAGRVADIINYAVLLAMMVADDEGAAGAPEPDEVRRVTAGDYTTLYFKDGTEIRRNDRTGMGVYCSYNPEDIAPLPLKRIETDPQVYRDALKKVPISDVERTFGEPMGKGHKRKKK